MVSLATNALSHRMRLSDAKKSALAPWFLSICALKDMEKRLKLRSSVELDCVFSFCVSFIGTIEAVKFLNKRYISLVGALVTRLKLKVLDTSVTVILRWMEKNPRAMLRTFDLNQSDDLNHDNLSRIIELVPSVFPKLRVLKIQMCQSLSSLLVMDVPFTLKTGGCLQLCSIPEVYNTLSPIEFVLTHVAMIKYGYDDSELFIRKTTWTKFLLCYNIIYIEDIRAVVRVRGTRSPRFRKGVDIGGDVWIVQVLNNFDLFRWKLKKNNQGFWRTCEIKVLF